MTKNEDLKSCPFCDKPPLVGGLNNEWVRCKEHIEGWIKRDVWNTRPTVTPTDGDAERAFDDLLDYLQASACGKIAMKYNKFNPKDAVKTIRTALQSTRKPPVHCSMAVDLTEWLYELFCESQSIDMHDVQTKMVDLGIIEGIEATTEDIDNGFDTNDIVFHKTEEYKKQSRKPPVDKEAVYKSDLKKGLVTIDDHTGVRTRDIIGTLKDRNALVPADTIAVPMEVLQGVREALGMGIAVIDAYKAFCLDQLDDYAGETKIKQALASLDAVLEEVV